MRNKNMISCMKKLLAMLIIISVFTMAALPRGTITVMAEEEIFSASLDDGEATAVSIPDSSDPPEIADASQDSQMNVSLNVEDPGTSGIPDQEILSLVPMNDELGAAMEDTGEADSAEISPSGTEDLGAGGDGTALGAYVTPSANNVTITRGKSVTINCYLRDFHETVYLNYSSSNTSAFGHSWGGYNANQRSFPLTLTGYAAGSGTITIQMRSSASNRVLAQNTIHVTVKPAAASLSVSTVSMDVAVGETKSINVTLTGDVAGDYIQAYYDEHKVSCQWGSWSGNTIPLYVRGVAAGRNNIEISLRAGNDTVILKLSVSINVYQRSNPRINLSRSSVTLDAGTSTTIGLSYSGFSGSATVAFGCSNDNAIECRWSGNNGESLVISGKNQGSGTVTIYLSQNGRELARASISVTVRSVKNPEISASRSSLTLKSGEYSTIDISYYNVSGSIHYSFENSNSSVCDVQWVGGWNGNKHSLQIRGKSAGSCNLTVYLVNHSTNAHLASCRVTIQVTGGTNSLQNIGFGFGNYSQPGIDLWICQYMFGNTEKAKQVYRDDIGNGGVCFGMASGAGLLNIRNQLPVVSTFSSTAANISGLGQNDRSSSLGINVKNFVEAMHISQVSNDMHRHYGVNDLVNTVISETNAGRPVLIGIYGMYNNNYCGHAILAFGYEQVNSTTMKLRIYDSNYTNSPTDMTETSFFATRSSSSGSYTGWSYNFWGNIYWGTSQPSYGLNFITYNDYFNVWQNRGSLGSTGLNLISSTEKDFSLYNFTGDLVAKYENGGLVYKGEGVIECPKYNILPGGQTADVPNMLYVPVDLYTVVDDSPETPISIGLADDGLSINMETDVEMFDLCADDISDTVSCIMTPQDGETYRITIGSSIEGRPSEITMNGIGTGAPISIGMEAGNLSMSGVEGMSLSVLDEQDTYGIMASAGEGGFITPEGLSELSAGESIMYTITPDEGYAVKAVYVDGVNVGAVEQYAFESVDGSHVINAEFGKSLENCTVSLSRHVFMYDGEAHIPEVTVTAPAGEILAEHEDYELSCENNVQTGEATLYIMAAKDGGYCGVKEMAFLIVPAENRIADLSFSRTDMCADITMYAAQEAVAVVAAYDIHGSMTAVRLAHIPRGIHELQFDFESEELTDEGYLKAFLLDESMSPLTGPAVYTTTVS